MSRALWLLAAIAMLAVTVSGCNHAPAETDSGGSDTAAPVATGTGGDTANTPYQQALQFADCMRQNGVPAFPDPDQSGAYTLDTIANGTSIDVNSAAFSQAISACRNLEPAGFTGSQRSPEQQAAALKFAQCMRDNGVTDFPDPAPDAPIVDTRLIPSTARNGGMTILRAAMQKCTDYAREAGVQP